DAIERSEESRYAVGFQIHVDRFRRLAEDAFRENRQRRLIGWRLAVITNLHGFTDTPPSTPLYHTSLSGDSPRISSKCAISVSRLISTSRPSFWARTTSSG